MFPSWPEVIQETFQLHGEQYSTLLSPRICSYGTLYSALSTSKSDIYLLTMNKVTNFVPKKNGWSPSFSDND